MSDDKVDIWMPLYIGDYLGSTSRLTTELHGAYLLLIMDYWKNGPPPDNDSILASITKMTPDAWSIARAVLEEYFDVIDGEWVHGRIEREKSSSIEKKSVAKQKAKAAAEARWRKEKNATSMLQAMPEDMLEECPSSSPSSNKDKNKPAGKTASSAVGINSYLDRCKEEGQKPIKPEDKIFQYAEDAGIPSDFLRLCWLEFVERNQASKKRQKDWPATFRNCVRGNWYKLWWLDGSEYMLTTQGKQAELKHKNSGRAA